MSNAITCEWCGAAVEGADLEAFCEAFLVHVRSAHAEFPYPDHAVRNYAEATQRLTGAVERLESIGAITVERVTPERLDDWLGFFDYDAFAGKPEWAACYCSEPHVLDPTVALADQPARTARDNRETMIGLLRSGRSCGYLAYVAGRPAGWVNASMRSEYARYRRGGDAQPADSDVIAIACFIIAPPYRRHGVARALLEGVLADAPSRGGRMDRGLSGERRERGRSRQLPRPAGDVRRIRLRTIEGARARHRPAPPRVDACRRAWSTVSPRRHPTRRRVRSRPSGA